MRLFVILLTFSVQVRITARIITFPKSTSFDARTQNSKYILYFIVSVKEEDKKDDDQNQTHDTRKTRITVHNTSVDGYRVEASCK